MQRKAWGCGIIVLLLFIWGCGGLRYSLVTPEAKDFHPKRIGILPVDVGPREEARGIVDEVLAGELARRGWFQDVIAAGSLNRQLQTNEVLRKAVQEYVAKLKTVNFSDPDLSRKIGELINVDTLLIVNLDYWQYTTEDNDKVAKVGFSVKMVNVDTGGLLWEATHQEVETYTWWKPELTAVAKKLAARMMSEMPH